MPLRYRFPKSRRVTRSARFTLVLRRGSCAADNTLVVFALRQAATGRSRRGEPLGISDQGTPRLGVTIPKKVGNAVTRNRWKRWIRESFRTQPTRFPAGFDYVVRPKKGARGDWPSIRQSLPRLAQKAVRRLDRRS